MHPVCPAGPVISIRFTEYDCNCGVLLGEWRCREAARIGERGPDWPRSEQQVEATIPALRRYARALTRDSDIADDLVQDTLVRALRSEHLFHGGEVRSWLYTILTNLNRNRLRSLARRPMLSSLDENDAPDLAGPEAGGRDIERALATLSLPCTGRSEPRRGRACSSPSVT